MSTIEIKVNLKNTCIGDKMMSMGNKLIDYINQELKDRAWSIRRLARESGVSQTQISNVLSEQRSITFEFCKDIAIALGESPDRLFRLAGLLPSSPEEQKKPSPNAMLEEIYQAVKSGQLARITDERLEYLISGSGGDDPTFKELLDFARRLNHEERLQLIKYAAFLESQRNDNPGDNVAPAPSGA